MEYCTSSYPCSLIAARCILGCNFIANWHRMRHGSTKTAGYSLLEMLVALAIVAGVLVMTVPYISSHQGERIEPLALTIAALMRGAHSNAMTSGEDATLSYDIEHKVFGALPDGKLVKLPDGVSLELTIATQSVSTTTASLVFFPDGSSTGGRVILSTKQSRISVIADWLTSAVRVERIDKDETPLHNSVNRD